jgi:Poxvirus A32 protein
MSKRKKKEDDVVTYKLKSRDVTEHFMNMHKRIHFNPKCLSDFEKAITKRDEKAHEEVVKRMEGKEEKSENLASGKGKRRREEEEKEDERLKRKIIRGGKEQDEGGKGRHEIKPLNIPGKYLKEVKDIDEELPEHPFYCGIIAQRNSGKTTLIVNLLMYKSMYGGKFDNVHIWSPTIKIDGAWKNLHIKEDKSHEEYKDGDFKKLMDEVEDKNDGQSHLVIIDDMTEQVKNDLSLKEEIEMLGFKSRHWNISVIIVIHQLKFMSAATRTALSDIIIFNINNSAELEKISEENRGHLSRNEFLDMYHYAVNEPYQFFYIKKKEIEEERFRVGFDEIIDVNQFKDPKRLEKESQRREYNGRSSTKTLQPNKDSNSSVPVEESGE